MKKITAIILCLIICIAFAAGCGSKQQETTAEETATAPDESLYGTWKEDYFDSGYVFNSDGTGEDTFWELPFTYTTEEGGTLLITFTDEMWGSTTYSYEVNGDTLTMQQEDSSDSYEYQRQ